GVHVATCLTGLDLFADSAARGKPGRCCVTRTSGCACHLEGSRIALEKHRVSRGTPANTSTRLFLDMGCFRRKVRKAYLQVHTGSARAVSVATGVIPK